MSLIANDGGWEPSHNCFFVLFFHREHKLMCPPWHQHAWMLASEPLSKQKTITAAIFRLDELWKVLFPSNCPTIAKQYEIDCCKDFLSQTKRPPQQRNIGGNKQTQILWYSFTFGNVNRWLTFLSCMALVADAWSKIQIERFYVLFFTTYSVA